MQGDINTKCRGCLLPLPSLVTGKMKREDSNQRSGAVYFVAVYFLLASLLNLPLCHDSPDNLVSSLNEETGCFADVVRSEGDPEDDNHFPAVQPERVASVLPVSQSLRRQTLHSPCRLTFSRQARAPPQFIS